MILSRNKFCSFFINCVYANKSPPIIQKQTNEILNVHSNTIKSLVSKKKPFWNINDYLSHVIFLKTWFYNVVLFSISYSLIILASQYSYIRYQILDGNHISVLIAWPMEITGSVCWIFSADRRRLLYSRHLRPTQ